MYDLRLKDLWNGTNDQPTPNQERYYRKRNPVVSIKSDIQLISRNQKENVQQEHVIEEGSTFKNLANMTARKFLKWTKKRSALDINNEWDHVVIVYLKDQGEFWLFKHIKNKLPEDAKL